MPSYENAHTVPFGKPVALPGPVELTLETQALKEWVR